MARVPSTSYIIKFDLLNFQLIQYNIIYEFVVHFLNESEGTGVQLAITQYLKGVHYYQ